MTARFNTPVIQDNPTGWGPNTIPPQFKDMPYQPFSKSDRLGKVRELPRGNGFARKWVRSRVNLIKLWRSTVKLLN